LLTLLGVLQRRLLRGLSAAILLLVLLLGVLWLLLLRLCSLWLLGPLLLLLLLLRFLSRLSAMLLLGLPLLWLLSGLSVLFLPRLRALLLCRRPALLLFATPAGFRLRAFFLLPVLLRVCRVKDSEEDKQGGGTGCSNELHGSNLR